MTRGGGEETGAVRFQVLRARDSSSPLDFDGVGLENRVRADERCSFNDGLRHEQAVEWVPMVAGKLLQRQDVRLGNRQDGHTVGLLLMGYDLGQGSRRSNFPNCRLIWISHRLVTLRMS